MRTQINEDYQPAALDQQERYRSDMKPVGAHRNILDEDDAFDDERRDDRNEDVEWATRG